MCIYILLHVLCIILNIILPKTLSYNKNEKLKSKKQMDVLFATGKNFLVFPFKVVYSFGDNRIDENIKVGVGVSKKSFKNATDRNRIKRLLRESYRINKINIHKHITQKSIDIFILFIDKNMPAKRMDLDSKMIKALDKIINIYNSELVV